LTQEISNLKFILISTGFLIPLLLILQLFSSQFVYVNGQIFNSSNTSFSTSFNNNSVVSTRGHFDLATGEPNPKYNSTEYYYNDIGDNKRRTQNKIMCPSQNEIAIYIHGEWTNKVSAIEQFNRTAISLVANDYAVPLIGLNWDSNTPISEYGWKVAKNIAEKN
jgi:hypothetical protein